MFLTRLPNDVPSPTAGEEDLLRAQTITPGAPGPILRDFEALLNFVGEAGVRVSAKQHVFGGSTLRDLNARLSRPLAATFKRPQQKSFPYIHALYLLLRASGMAYVEQQGRQQVLRLDPAAVSAWDRLNLTEQYFNLYEAWMTRLYEEAILGSHRIDPMGPFYRCYMFLSRLPAEGQAFTTYSEQEELRYHPGLHHLALLDLFGLIEIEDATTTADDGWRPHRFSPCPFGTALMNLTGGLYQSSMTSASLDDEGSPWPPGELQEWLQLYFPEWKHDLAMPLMDFREGVFIFKASLGPKVWRRIAAPAQAKLKALANAILDAFAFEDRYHLDRFTVQGPTGLPVAFNHPEFEEGPWTDRVRVGDVPLREGQTMTYLFDFGDRWEFDMLLERIEPGRQMRPTLLKSHGDAPEQYPDGDEDDFILFFLPDDESEPEDE